MEPRVFLDILHVAERLKDTPRHCTTSHGRRESVAEHSWRISLMALLVKDEFPGLDAEKLMAMCLIHDLGECFTGDIPVFRKTQEDREREDALLAEWVDGLPEPTRSELQALYREMDAQQTTEAKVYKALDKLENGRLLAVAHGAAGGDPGRHREENRNRAAVNSLHNARASGKHPVALALSIAKWYSVFILFFGVEAAWKTKNRPGKI